MALRAALTCAEDMASSSASGHSPLAYSIVSYVRQAAKDLSGFVDADAGISLGSLAFTMEEEMDNRKANLRNVPLLSQKLYTDILSQYASIFAVYQSR